MFHQARRFLRRHRGAIIVGAVAGVVVGGLVRARRTFDETLQMLSDAERQMNDLRLRQQHLDRIKRECDEALLRFITTLQVRGGYCFFCTARPFVGMLCDA